jgi:hypothetical protein
MVLLLQNFGSESFITLTPLVRLEHGEFINNMQKVLVSA